MVHLLAIRVKTEQIVSVFLANLLFSGCFRQRLRGADTAYGKDHFWLCLAIFAPTTNYDDNYVGGFIAVSLSVLRSPENHHQRGDPGDRRLLPLPDR